MGALARSVGVVVGAGALAAIYQLTYDEMRGSIQSRRVRRHYKRQRNDLLLRLLLGGKLKRELQEKLLNSRDAFKTCCEILVKSETSEEDRAEIHAVFAKMDEAFTTN